jgi:hypothetical protein
VAAALDTWSSRSRGASGTGPRAEAGGRRPTTIGGSPSSTCTAAVSRALRERHQSPGRSTRRRSSTPAAALRTAAFRLAIGGFGLFGFVPSATPRLVPRRRLSGWSRWATRSALPPASPSAC